MSDQTIIVIFNRSWRSGVVIKIRKETGEEFVLEPGKKGASSPDNGQSYFPSCAARRPPCGKTCRLVDCLNPLADFLADIWGYQYLDMTIENKSMVHTFQGIRAQKAVIRILPLLISFSECPHLNPLTETESAFDLAVGTWLEGAPLIHNTHLKDHSDWKEQDARTHKQHAFEHILCWLRLRNERDAILNGVASAAMLFT
ncbi:hypothetical protein [Tichowtungia aerotolerans]|uniref:Uncharacterized protein n=1 Tax=Tichowtungia aerotolerans TaxID=2697043 RepID=A0A6P1ME71_9BACT|nr:hypothetical protein [Tichowtungia aerotolerans]QHI69385.1 hypothetical protein GT409_07940 [Tichowtungia aerotolerans]